MFRRVSADDLRQCWVQLTQRTGHLASRKKKVGPARPIASRPWEVPLWSRTLRWARQPRPFVGLVRLAQPLTFHRLGAQRTPGLIALAAWVREVSSGTRPDGTGPGEAAVSQALSSGQRCFRVVRSVSTVFRHVLGGACARPASPSRRPREGLSLRATVRMAAAVRAGVPSSEGLQVE